MFGRLYYRSYITYGAKDYCGVMLSYEVCMYQVWWKSKTGVYFCVDFKWNYPSAFSSNGYNWILILGDCVHVALVGKCYFKLHELQLCNIVTGTVIRSLIQLLLPKRFIESYQPRLYSLYPMSVPKPKSYYTQEEQTNIWRKITKIKEFFFSFFFWVKKLINCRWPSTST